VPSKAENFGKLGGREHLNNLGVLTLIFGSKMMNRGSRRMALPPFSTA